ncbi:MAG: GDSL-type esterase/lipase family protein [Christensenellales bacterium]|jgi:lysophospholipase L1-like esterase
MIKKLRFVITWVLMIAMLGMLGACGNDNAKESAAPPESLTQPPANSAEEEPSAAPSETQEEPSLQQPEAPSVEPTRPSDVPFGTVPEEMPESLDTYFDDAAIIGDSVTLKLRNYAVENELLGDVKFLCSGDFGVGHAVNYTLNVTFRGEEVKLEDALRDLSCKKVFIMLGMNDLVIYGIDGAMELWGKLIENIRTQSPDIQIFIQSMTPIYTAGQLKILNNENIDNYNLALEQLAQDNDCTFMNLAPYFKDQDGGLIPEYCSDEYVHFTDRACKVWIDLLRAEAQRQTQ